MIEWLLIQTVLLSIFVSLMIIGARFLNHQFGAQNTYKLWLIAPLTLLTTVLLELVPNEASVLITKYLVFANSAVQQFAYSFDIGLQSTILAAWLIVATSLLFSFFQRFYQHAKDLDLKQELSFRSDIPVFSTRQSVGPQIIGVLYPKIIIPEDFGKRFDETQQHLIIQHELNHWRQGDTFWNLLALIILALFWFNPFIWLAYKHFRQQQELSCDAKVLANKSMASRQQYALAMINVSCSSDTPSFTQLYYGEKMNMKNRIESLVKHKPSQAYPAAIAILLGSLFLGASHFALAKDQVKSEQVSDVPIYRVNPIYPAQAAKDNIRGWVHLSFDVETDGSVSDVKIVNAEPKWTFETSAQEAVSQWKYQSRTMRIDDAEVMLNFELESSDSKEIATINAMEQIEVNKNQSAK